MQINPKSGLLIGLAVLLTMALSGGVVATAQGDPLSCTLPEGEPTTISAAKLYIEFMSTGIDLGVHGYFDDHGWSELCVYDPNGTLVLAVKPQSQLYDLTMAGIFFESREPVIEEYPFEALFAQFPEGEYRIIGTNFDGTGLTGTAIFTHNVAAPPVITAPVLTEEDLIADVVHPVGEMVVSWEPVTETIDGRAVTIVGYEIIVTNMDGKHPASFAQPIYDVHLPADRTSLTVPAEFFQPGTRYEVEIVAIEESGNQTINNGYFTTE
ncbi:MAG: fibronectin type III domain-containing protein [Chloroflexi bacterium]|nr:fibronectin type III domain-containing protein [Chloroflexota bacterium]